MIFEKPVYTVSESENVEICLLLNCPAAQDVTVTISVQEGGDAGKEWSSWQQVGGALNCNFTINVNSNHLGYKRSHFQPSSPINLATQRKVGLLKLAIKCFFSLLTFTTLMPLLVNGEDFVAATRDVPFSAGETRACALFDIINDEVEEEFEESFSVCIDSATPPDDVNITLGNVITTIVVIQDDDSE